MSDLQVKDLRKTSMIKFLMNDGTIASVDMEILNYKPLLLLQFEGEHVRFVLGMLEKRRMFFSTERVYKRVKWQYSKRSGRLA